MGSVGTRAGTDIYSAAECEMPETERPTAARRLLWFVALWMLGVGSVMAVAMLLRAVLKLV